jgi:hypothetical protein
MFKVLVFIIGFIFTLGLLISLRVYLFQLYFRKVDEQILGGAIFYSNFRNRPNDYIEQQFSLYDILGFSIVSFSSLFVLFNVDGDNSMYLLRGFIVFIFLSSLFLSVIDILKIRYILYKKEDDWLRFYYEKL